MIYTIGETVIDLIFKNMQPQAAKVGGSALNTSVSLGRLGNQVSFISEIGCDELGSLCKSFLTQNGVQINYLVEYKDKKTSLALAFLNENNDASYQFYKEFTDPMVSGNVEFSFRDLLLFSSSFSLNSRVRQYVANILHNAKSKGLLIMYDPNMRKKLDKESTTYLYIQENFGYAEVVHMSDEDASFIFGTTNGETIFMELQKYGVQVLVYTQNKNNVIVYAKQYVLSYTVPAISVVSTIGAGDTFNAGILHCFAKHVITKETILNLTQDFWDKTIPFAIACASNVCQSIDNYIDISFAKSVL